MNNKIIILAVSLILLVSVIGFASSARNSPIVKAIITGFTVYGKCDKNLAVDPDLVSGQYLISCLDYCDEYAGFNLNELSNNEEALKACHEGYNTEIMDNRAKLEECEEQYGNQSEKQCKKYTNKIIQLEKSSETKCEKYQKNIDKYNNIFENCAQVEEFIFETNPYNYEVYQAYLNAEGTDCIKTIKKDKVWNPIADVNKDGRVNKKDRETIFQNVENSTFGQLAYIDVRDYCEATCFDAGGADLCRNDETCSGNSLEIKGLGGSCCDVMCKECEDSDDTVERKYIDSGMFTFGNVTDKFDKFAKDACKGEKNLKEQYCSEKGTAKGMGIKCPRGECEGGACIPTKCSDGIHDCADTGEPLCKIGSELLFDCACIPPGYYKLAEDTKKELVKPFKQRKGEIEDALEEDSGFSILSIAIGFIGGIVLGPLVGGVITGVVGGGSTVVATIGGYGITVQQIANVAGSQVVSEGTNLITGGVVIDLNETNQTGQNETEFNLKKYKAGKKAILIRELGWLQEKIKSIKVDVACDEYENIVFLDCTGAVKCQEEERVLYPGNYSVE